ncbi:MAG: TMEM175 family protein, partial [Lactococcus cremoris]
MEKERFLAFTDAINAIISTIMVLEFKTPDKSGWPALTELTVPLLAYALSFFMIMTVWYNHHQLYRD